MLKCEYEAICKEAYDFTEDCEKLLNETGTLKKDCPAYKMAILVHNQTIEDISKKSLKAIFSPERDPDQRVFRCLLEKDFQALKKVQDSGEMIARKT